MNNLNNKTTFIEKFVLSKHLSKVRPAWGGVAVVALTTLFMNSFANDVNIYIYNRVLIASMAAIALQFLLGTAGLVSVGNSAFLLIGSFGAVICMRAGIEFPFDLFFVAIVCGIVGLIAGLPSIRIRALFLALSTLAIFYLSVFFGNIYQSHDASAAAAGFIIPKVFQSTGFTNAGHYWSWMLVGFFAIVVLTYSRLMSERSGRA